MSDSSYHEHEFNAGYSGGDSVRLRWHEAWDAVALNVDERWGEGEGSVEVFIVPETLREMAGRALAYAMRLEEATGGTVAPAVAEEGADHPEPRP